MSNEQRQGAQHLGPKQGEIAALAVTTASEEHALATVLGKSPAGKFVTIVATVDTYAAFSDGSAAALNEATLDTPGSTAACVLIPADTFVRWFVTGSHLSLKGSGSGNVRLWISSHS